MNESGDYICSCDYIRNFQFNGWFSEPETKNLNAFDFFKYYISFFMGKGCTFGWPLYSEFDEFRSFDGDTQAGFYYIKI